MFHLGKIEEIAKNPMLASELIKHLSVFELMECANRNNDKEKNILNHPSIINGILGSEDPGKILFLASSSRLSDLMDKKNFGNIFKMGEVFRSALYGNHNFDWYALFIFHAHLYVDDIMRDIMSDEKFKIVFYKNPRMDRRLIASIIAGKSRIEKTSFDFEKIPMIERFQAAKHSLDVKEIQSDFWIGKDMPDDNEMYFDEPFSAILVLVRDLITKYEDPQAQSLIADLVFRIPHVNLKLDHTDWISEEQKATLKSDLSGNFSKTMDRFREIAFVNIIKFFANATSTLSISIQPDSEENGSYLKDVKHFAPAALGITIIGKILRKYSLSNKKAQFINLLLKSENWVLRAAAYAFLYEQIDLRDQKNDEIFDKFIAKFQADADALMHGFFHSTHTQVFKKVLLSSGEKIQTVVELSNLNHPTRKYLSDTVSYMYDPPSMRNNDQIDDFISAFMRDADINLVKNIVVTTGLKTEHTQDRSPFNFRKLFR